MIELAIDVQADGGGYGEVYRACWPAVPAVGDRISLDGEHAGTYRVQEVTWLGEVGSAAWPARLAGVLVRAARSL